ncbi:MAG: excinuclease ABC subunit UvrC [Polyangiaceae bacterium]|nr:excinuclease ABC subunit UvrC [Polyangiaceae bacterium]
MPGEALAQKLAELPAAPGCYLFRDAAGRVLYVGKAKSLRSRVRSYFADGARDERAFTARVDELVADVETVVTANEKEAAILENSLIKELTPRFNVKLRDDKEFLSLRLSAEHPFPRLELTRRPARDGARYFGPYPSATAARRTLHLVERHFQLRTCTDRELRARRRPCIQHQIGRCLAPCVLDVDPARYAAQVRDVGLFLEGRHDELTSELEARMKAAAAAFEFERAAQLRDQLAAVRHLRETQRVVAVTDADQDVIGVYREGDRVETAVLELRAGRVVEIATFGSAGVELPEDELVAALLRERYAEDGARPARVPDEILVSVLPDAAAGVAEWLSERRAAQQDARGERRSRCALLAPARGPRRRLLELAQENAAHAFREKRRVADDVEAKLARLQARLRLPVLPRRIECVDVSHLGGEDAVAAVVCFENGEPAKAGYRGYHVRSVRDGDDYAALAEVLGRRFRRGLAAASGGEEVGPDGASVSVDGAAEGAPPPEPPAVEGRLPDLFVVDGGRGQLAVALAAAGDLGLHGLAIVGLAKERETRAGERVVDRVYLPGQKNPIALRPKSPELRVLAHARDEAHRFANLLRVRKGRARRFTSTLDSIPGIGPKTRALLLRTFGGVAAVAAATDEALLAVKGVSRAQVAALRAALAERDGDGDPAAPAIEQGASPAGAGGEASGRG